MRDFARPHLWVDFILHVEFQTSTPYFAQHCLHVYRYPNLKFYIFDFFCCIYPHPSWIKLFGRKFVMVEYFGNLFHPI
jgi:hypothetical protein